ncbi:hypothetical protein CsSME_00038466 [Camellia sinensis var. sinensis]
MNSVFGQSTGPSCSGNTSNEMGDFECNICFEFTEDPIVTLCGHLYCWPCLYRWLHIHSHFLEEEKLVPIYGRGKTSSDPRFRSIPGEDIPHRPAGQRPETAPPPAPDANYFRQEQDGILGGFMPRGAANYFRQEQDGILGVFMPRGAARVGNFTLSAAFGGLIPSFNLQVHGFNYANAYAPPTDFIFYFITYPSCTPLYLSLIFPLSNPHSFF